MRHLSILTLLFIIVFSSCAQSQQKSADKSTFKTLTPEEERVIVHKGTEAPFTGKYDTFFEAGTYVCKRCGAALYQSEDKFDAHCGWPSFDDEIKGAVKRTVDADGYRTEITCANCGAHLGHVFEGERLTRKNTRHCVNSISLEFIPNNKSTSAKMDTAYFAGGCFWGVEFYMEKAPGVVDVVSGYMGGKKKNPTYQQVSYHKTGHAETVQIIFDPTKISFESLARLFFEIHDPTQVNRQGPDVGDQYRSEVFYTSEAQKQTTEKLINILTKEGYLVATQVTKAGDFWKAEDYHQDYYDHKGTLPYCHGYVKRFKD